MARERLYADSWKSGNCAGILRDTDDGLSLLTPLSRAPDALSIKTCLDMRLRYGKKGPTGPKERHCVSESYIPYTMSQGRVQRSRCGTEGGVTNRPYIPCTVCPKAKLCRIFATLRTCNTNNMLQERRKAFRKDLPSPKW